MPRIILVASLVLALVPACRRSNPAGAGADMATGDGGGGGGGAGGGGGGGVGGGCATACTGGQQCIGGTCACATYQSDCNGQCVQTVNDPNNCGGCGNKCTGNTFCWLGKCAASCPFNAGTGQGLKPCSNACVDTDTDNNNCGGCGIPCTKGTVCSDGHCVTGIKTTPGPTACMGIGPPITVGGDGGGKCAGTIAQTSFTWALCACGDVNMNQRLYTDGFNSTQGPYVPGQASGAVGINGVYGPNQLTDVGGTFWTASTAGLGSNQTFRTRQDLYVNGPVVLNQDGSVGLDAFINGHIIVNGPGFKVGKTLHLPANVTPPARVTYGQLVNNAPVPVTQPCDCDPNKLVPVNDIVDYAKTHNDNASIGLDPAVLSAFGGGTTRLDLPCGNYYLTSIHTDQALTIVAHGHTALYVGGDITPNQALAITVDPVGSFDIFVKGTINTNQKLSAGSLNAPALLRLYLGSKTVLDLNQGFLLAGNLYSASSAVNDNQTADIYGAVFSGSFTGNQNVNIHYDTAITTQGETCSPPPVDGGGPACNSCTDCGNQACVNHSCGPCTRDSDCCAPLACVQGKCLSLIP